MKARLRRVEQRIKATQKPCMVFYEDESGCFFDKAPWKAEAQQLTREYVERFTRDTGVLCFVVKPEKEPDDWSRMLNS